ncbi:MAG: hypothetical protein HC876_19930 [Chloroflexaceae bacterium]|nr:hypothetical protein [Chloroflexaceae bacterium]
MTFRYDDLTVLASAGDDLPDSDIDSAARADALKQVIDSDLVYGLSGLLEHCSFGLHIQ